MGAQTYQTEGVLYVSGYAFRLRVLPEVKVIMLDPITGITAKDIIAINNAGYDVIIDPYGNFLTVNPQFPGRVSVIRSSFPFVDPQYSLYPSGFRVMPEFP